MICYRPSDTAQLLVCEEDDVTYYYTALSPEDWAGSCFLILARRLEQGVYDYEEDEEFKDQAERLVSEGHEANKPEGVYRKSTGELLRYTCPAAKLLEQREAYQYEGVDLEPLESTSTIGLLATKE